MKRKFVTKIVALTMASAVMVSPLTAQAADKEVTDPDTATGTVEGSGNVEAIVDTDVFSVVLPTVEDHGDTFDFILDPQEVIKSTNNAAYEDATFNDHTGVYFNNAADTYGKDSAVLSAENKSSYDVDITLSATATNLTDDEKGYTIPLTSDNTFADDKTTSLYLALVSGDKTEPLTTDGATITNEIAALSDAYEIAYDTTDKTYEYQLKSDASGFKTCDFNLTGACNKSADWTAAKDATPKVDVTWTVEKHKAAPSAPASGTFVKGIDTVVSGISLGEGSVAATKATITMSKTNSKTGDYQTTVLPLNGDSVTVPGSSWSGASIGDFRYLKVVFNDAAKTTKYIEMTISDAVGPSAPSTATFTKGTDLTIPGISLGAGSLAATSVTATISKTNDSTGDYQTTTLPLSDGSITIPGSSWSGASSGDTRYVKLVFDDSASTTLYIEITIA